MLHGTWDKCISRHQRARAPPQTDHFEYSQITVQQDPDEEGDAFVTGDYWHGKLIH